MEALLNALRAAQAELSTNARLRLGLWVILGILAGYGLLVASDAVQARWQTVSELQQDIARLRSASRQTAWSRRDEDARKQLQTLQSLLWTQSSRGAAEAALLDLVKGTATRAKLQVRELSIAPEATAFAGNAASAVAWEAPLPAGVRSVRANLVVGYDRLPVLALLSELARQEQVLIVDQVVLRTQGSTPRAEIGVRMLYRETASGAR